MRSILLAILLTLAFSSQVGAQAVALRLSTLGPGLDVSMPVSERLSVRAGGSYFSYTRTATASDDEVDVDFDGSLKWGGLRLLTDWRPVGKGLRITGGFYYNLIEASGSGIPAEPYVMNEGESNEKVFSTDRLGSLSAKLTYGSKINPYAGIGFGDAHNGRLVTFLVDVGVIYLGSPTVEMRGTGMIAGTANQDARLSDGLESFRWLPVLSLGLAIRL